MPRMEQTCMRDMLSLPLFSTMPQSCAHRPHRQAARRRPGLQQGAQLSPRPIRPIWIKSLVVTYCKQYHSFFPKQRPIHSENPHPKCHLPCTSQTMRHHNCVSVHQSHAALVIGLHAVTACPTHCTIRCDSSPMPVLNEKCVAVMGGWAGGRI